MAELKMIITDKGKAAIKSALEAGKNIEITQAGFGSEGYTASSNQTALKKQVKRVASVAGDSPSSNMLHIDVKDESTDSYTVKEVSLYLKDGTFFAVYAQKDAIVEKAAAAIVLLTLDIAIDDIDATKFTFGDTTFSEPPATTTTRGVTMLSDSVNDKATDKAATANAVKKANDNANKRETPQGAQDKVDKHAKAGTAHNAGQISLKPPAAFSGKNSVQDMLESLGSAAKLNDGNGTGDIVKGGRQVKAGDGLTGGGNLTSDRTFRLGTPSKITASSKNSASGDTHTHEIEKASTKVAGIVQLNDATNNTSTSQAATANAVKKANDNANTRETPKGAQDKVDAHASAAKAHTAEQITAKPSSAFSGKNTLQAIVAALGSAAAKDVGTSDGDVMQVGAFGIGGGAILINNNDTIQNLTQSGLYAVRKQVPTDWPKGAGHYAQLIVNRESESNASYIVIDFKNQLFVGSVTGGKMNDWQRVTMSDELAAVATSGKLQDLAGVGALAPLDVAPVNKGGTGATNANNAMMNLGWSSNASHYTDFDRSLDGVKPGVYQWDNGTKNRPDGMATGGPVLIMKRGSPTSKAGVMIVGSAGGSNNTINKFSVSQLWLRGTDSAGTWSKWTRLATNDDVIPIDKGGTGATTAEGARKALGLANLANTANWSDINNKPAFKDAALKGVAGLNKEPYDYTLWKGNYSELTLAGDVYTAFMSLPEVARSAEYGDLKNRPSLGSAAGREVLDANIAWNELPWGPGQLPSTGTVRQVLGKIPAVNDISRSGNQSTRITSPSGDWIQVESDNTIKFGSSDGNVQFKVRWGNIEIGSMSAYKVFDWESRLGSMPAGGIGTYVNAVNLENRQLHFGDTTSGSNLKPSSSDVVGFETQTLSGTWRCMGASNGSSDNLTYKKTTLYLRVS
ncbi:tail fiber protein [Carnimonas bestiolae]|uniref:tail fiber protein n=1 Tax=Carnimonas bestiolae TaxID=3402172 RepID=UPI003EDC2979